MQKIINSPDKQVYVAKDAIKEIVICENSQKAAIYTEKNIYETDIETARRLISNRNKTELEHLVTAINNLTQMIRARIR